MLKKVSMLALLCAVTVGSAYSSRGDQEREIPRLSSRDYAYDAVFNPKAPYAAENVLNQLTDHASIINYLVSQQINEETTKQFSPNNAFTFQEEADYFSIKKILAEFEAVYNSENTGTFQEFCNKAKTPNATDVLNLYYAWAIVGTDAILKPFEEAYMSKAKELLVATKTNPENRELIGVNSQIALASNGNKFDFKKENILDEIFNAVENPGQNLAKVSDIITDTNTLNSVKSVSDAIKEARNAYAGSKAVKLDDYWTYSHWAVNTIGRGMIADLSAIKDNNDCVEKIKSLKNSLKTYEAKHKGFVEFLDTTLNIFAILGKEGTEEFLKSVDQYEREDAAKQLNDGLSRR